MKTTPFLMAHWKMQALKYSLMTNRSSQVVSESLNILVLSTSSAIKVNFLLPHSPPADKILLN